MSQLRRVGMVFAGLGILLARYSAEAAPEPDYIPLAKGNFWIYAGDVSWVERNSQTQKNQVHHQHLTWRSEIVDIVQEPTCTLALFRGFPTQLVWYHSQLQPSAYLVARIGTDYYSTQNGAPTDLFQKVRDAGPNWQKYRDDFDKLEMLFSSPLASGKCFGGTPSNYITGRYCYVVDGASPADLSQIEGAPKLDHPILYGIHYTSAPDLEEMDVVPGIGITHYGYHHNGTTMEVDVHLVQFGHAP